MSLLKLFCAVDDFMLSLYPTLESNPSGSRETASTSRRVVAKRDHDHSHSFHQPHYRTFKAYDTDYVQQHLSSEFPHLVSYSRFVALIPQMMIPLLAYFQSRYGADTGISFIDSTSLEVCDPKRIHQYRVFAL